MIYISIAGVYFVFVFLKAFQQRNVMYNNYYMIPPISYAMAMCEALFVFSVAKYATDIIELVAFVGSAGTGGWIGCICAMKAHDRVIGGVREEG